MFSLARRVQDINPFYVMEVVKEAAALQEQGKDIIHLSIGEPDFTALPEVVEALNNAARIGLSKYTPALGTDVLRAAVAKYYQDHLGSTVASERVVITAGASGALQLACSALVEIGAEVLMADPSYPCNRHFVTAVGGIAKLVPTDASTSFQLTAELVERHWGSETTGVLIATPSNPTGTLMSLQELQRIVDFVRARGGFVLVDEIYLGLVYEGERVSAASLGEDIVIINSFSKYFHMTGWRLGWMLVPTAYISAFEKLAQNFVICPNALAQHAALQCFTPLSLNQLELRREEFKARRDYLLPALRDLGMDVPVSPEGAFYIYVDVAKYGVDSRQFALDLLHEQGVCTVPGLDFGVVGASRYMRISYAVGIERLREAVARIERFLEHRGWLDGR